MNKRAICLALVAALFFGACSFGGGDEGNRVITAQFSRAIQIFPGNSVRVLGVTVGRVIDVRNVEGAAEVEIRIDDPDLKLPEDVKATLVPVSLLGERYVQLLPAYEGGPEFTGDSLSLERTSVPAEQDELLRSMQDYFGALDPEKVEEFVTNAATILEGNGESLNRLIEEGSGFFETLAEKRDSLAGLIQELDTLTTALATRQDKIARVIHSYNDVSRAINQNRESLEGTIDGLSRASAELAALLIDNRDPLGKNIKSFTRTFRTFDRNAKRFAKTGKWAVRLFNAAERAMDWEADWLRLGNQGAPLFELMMFRLEDRLVGVCMRLGVDDCSSAQFWQQRLPEYFCQDTEHCEQPTRRKNPTPGQALEDALDELPDEVRDEVGKELNVKKNCKNAKNPKRCRQKKKEQSEGDALDELLEGLMDSANGTLDGATGGGL